MPRLSLQLGDITMVDAEAIATSCSEDLVRFLAESSG
jgi:hypothetical protein